MWIRCLIVIPLQTIQEQIANGSSTIEPIKQNIINSVQDQSEIATPPGAVSVYCLIKGGVTVSAV